MWFGKNTKKIKLSRNLKWSIGRGQTPRSKLWTLGGTCLLIAVGLTLNAFRVSHEPTAQAESRVLGASIETPEKPKIQFMDYQVTKGDTLFNISQKYNISWGILAELNDLPAPYSLRQGQIIKIPIQ